MKEKEKFEKDAYKGKGKRGKGKGGNPKPKEGGNPKQKEVTPGLKSCNDVKWYGQNPHLLRDAGSVSFAQILGLPYAFSATDDSGRSVTYSDVIPGIMCINYIPTVGVSTDLNSNINVAARLVYTFMRHANSGNRNYESPDYMTYLLAVSNAQAYYAYMVRLYGLINYHSVFNRYITKGLVEAAGGDFADLQHNMSQFRYYINYFGNKINSCAVPKDQYYFDRSTFLPLHLFTDGEGPKTQIYLFKPEGFYKWTGTKYNTGSALEFAAAPNGTLNGLIEYGNALLDALLSNEDIGIMSGDTLKAFGANGIRQVASIAETFVTPIIMDDGMLAQIHNLVGVGAFEDIDPTTLDVTQEDGELKYQLKVTSKQAMMSDVILDTWLAEPDSNFVMEATRLITLTEYDQSDDSFKVVSSGTEVVTDYTIYSFDTDGDLVTFNGTSFHYSPTVGTEFMSKLTKFDWYPLLYVMTVASGSVSDVKVIGDLQNYTVCDRSTIDRLHNCAIQSLFNVYGLYLRQQ